MEPLARRLASRGVGTVAVQYRLSDQRDVTPLDTMADARDAIRWMRRHAAERGINPPSPPNR
jgi:acetyl esterase/lipase